MVMCPKCSCMNSGNSSCWNCGTKVLGATPKMGITKTVNILRDVEVLLS